MDPRVPLQPLEGLPAARPARRRQPRPLEDDAGPTPRKLVTVATTIGALVALALVALLLH